MIIVNFHKKFGEDPCSHTCIPGVSACTHILTHVCPLTPHVLFRLLLLLLGGKAVVESKKCVNQNPILSLGIFQKEVFLFIEV